MDLSFVTLKVGIAWQHYLISLVSNFKHYYISLWFKHAIKVRCIMAYVKMVNSELYPEPLFQSEAKCEAIEMTATLLMQIKLIVTRKVLHLCSF